MFDSLAWWVIDIITSCLFTVVCLVAYMVITKVSKISVDSLSPEVKDYSRKVTTARLINSSVKYATCIIVIIGLLIIWGVEPSAIITGAGLLSIAVGFGAQSLVNDMISGMFIFFEKQYDVGDTIEIDGFAGEVISLGFKSTVLQNWLGDIFVIGNGKINSLINYSQADSVALVEVKVESTTDFDKLKEVVENSLARIVLANDYFVSAPVYNGVTRINASGVQIRITAQTQPMRHFEGERAIRQALIDVFEKENIKFSYPKIEYKGEKNV